MYVILLMFCNIERKGYCMCAQLPLRRIGCLCVCVLVKVYVWLSE